MSESTFFRTIKASGKCQQEGIQPKLIQTDTMMINKIKYIHENPVKRGYVDEAVHWRYCSARDYEGVSGLIEIERFW